MGALLLMRKPLPPAVYLAGGTNDWRDHVRERWAGMNVILLDPFKDSDQRTLAAFTLDDLALVERSRCVLAYHDYHVYGGLALECGYAAALNRMVVYVCRQPRLDSMIAGVSKGVFTELDPALDFIERKLELKPRPEVQLHTVPTVGQPLRTEELAEDAEAGQVREGCCHDANTIHTHGSRTECCHGHESPNAFGWRGR